MNGIRIFLQHTGHGRRGPLYAARLDRLDGEVLATGTTEPVLDSARVLLARDFDSGTPVEVWSAGESFPRMRSSVGILAALTVRESEGGNAPRFVRYRRREDGPRGDTGCAGKGRMACPATPMASEAPASVGTTAEAA